MRSYRALAVSTAVAAYLLVLLGGLVRISGRVPRRHRR